MTGHGASAVSGAEKTMHNIDADALYARVTWRLVPFLFCCYICAYLDRVNVGFAKLQMQDQLAFSETVYGFGAGVFFLGYFLFEIPSNLGLHRYGARHTIASAVATGSTTRRG